MDKQKKIIFVLLIITVAFLSSAVTLFLMQQGEHTQTVDVMSDELIEESKTVKVPDPNEEDGVTDTSIVDENNSIESEIETQEVQDIQHVESEGWVSSHGSLHVDGTVLKDEYGEEIRLCGVSSHGLMWFYEFTNAGAMATTADYGANVVRIAMYSDDDSGGFVQNREMSSKLMYNAIENAKQNDMYVIVDWHVLHDQDPNRNVGVAKEFFTDITTRYGDDSAIIYEICNEPNGETTWDQIKSYADQIIPCIRSNAPSSLIIVGTPNYSYSVDSVIGNALSYDNVAYSFHYYAGQHGDDYNQIIDSCINNGIPVFISEWGINKDIGGDESLDKARSFIDYMNNRGLSWCCWSLCNKDECFSLIRSDCNKLSDWGEDDLTDVGKLIFSSFR